MYSVIISSRENRWEFKDKQMRPAYNKAVKKLEQLVNDNPNENRRAYTLAVTKNNKEIFKQPYISLREALVMMQLEDSIETFGDETS